MFLSEDEALWQAPQRFDPMFAGAFPTVTIGGMPIAALSIGETVAMMLRAARERPRGYRPLYLTSANGEVVSRYHDDPAIATLFDQADMINADGQPLVMASRILCDQPLPERVATTDLFEPMAAAASREGLSFYFFGATEEENRKAVATVRERFPRLRIAGRSHGFLRGEELARKIEEIDALAPDILWLALGVPREQAFVVAWSSRLRNVGMIKTSGGLFNFLSGTNSRAPRWMQKVGLEWAYRTWLEPRRLFWRYLVTNPKALVHIIRRSQ